MSINGVAQVSPGDGSCGAQNRILRTIWDEGGNDTYDPSNYTTNQFLDLRPGFWSKFADAQLTNLGPDAQNVPQMARANLFNALLFNNDVASLIENAFGGTGNDAITGNQAANNMRGNAGNDTLIGGLGTDILPGGAGDDLLYGGLEETLASSDAGNRDWLVGGAGNDTIYGGDGNDLILTGLGNNVIDAGAGADIVYGGAGADTITLGAGNDWPG